MHKFEEIMGCCLLVGFCMSCMTLLMSVYIERDLTTNTFGISRFEAAKLKESCEKSLPRDEKCVPKLTYEVK